MLSGYTQKNLGQCSKEDNHTPLLAELHYYLISFWSSYHFLHLLPNSSHYLLHACLHLVDLILVRLSRLHCCLWPLFPSLEKPGRVADVLFGCLSLYITAVLLELIGSEGDGWALVLACELSGGVVHLDPGGRAEVPMARKTWGWDDGTDEEEYTVVHYQMG